MSTEKPRVCIIGAGPSGMSIMYQIEELYPEKIEFECYEKQATWGGQWNYTWRTGVDEFGERIHNCMYRNLWALGPKESVEFKDYTFENHFGKELPSYLPREMYRQYLDGRMQKVTSEQFLRHVHFNHDVNSVEYRDSTDDFVVWVRDLKNNTQIIERFSHIVVASGSYSYPNMPNYPGIDTFSGRILHSQEFREAKEFPNQKVLLIGGRFSASEIAVQLQKYGSKHVIISCKEPMEIQWPEGIEEKPIVDEIRGNTVLFVDKTQFEFDAIIYCTGYRYNYPFLKGDLHFNIDGKTNPFPDNLYKGTLWLKGGNGKLFHMAAYEAFFNFGLFDAHSIWVVKFIAKELHDQTVQQEEMEKYVKDWQAKLNNVKLPIDHIKFQRDFYHDIGKDVGYPPEYINKAYDILVKHFENRQNNIVLYKDENFKSMFTGKLAPSHHNCWANCMDDSIDAFLL